MFLFSFVKKDLDNSGEYVKFVFTGVIDNQQQNLNEEERKEV